jgi:hypothetical protein
MMATVAAIYLAVSLAVMAIIVSDWIASAWRWWRR